MKPGNKPAYINKAFLNYSFDEDCEEVTVKLDV